jgi:hypothetical protein
LFNREKTARTISRKHTRALVAAIMKEIENEGDIDSEETKSHNDCRPFKV